MPRSQASPRAASDRVADVRWGVSVTAVVTALAWIPATLMFLLSGAVLREAERRQFMRIGAAYLLLVVAAGVVLGLGRRIATRSSWGAALVGAWIGAQSLVLGEFLAGTVRPHDHRLLAFSALIGAFAGGCAAPMFRARAKAWAARTGETERAP